jgi:hypothetical protein
MGVSVGVADAELAVGAGAVAVLDFPWREPATRSGVHGRPRDLACTGRVAAGRIVEVHDCASREDALAGLVTGDSICSRDGVLLPSLVTREELPR